MSAARNEQLKLTATWLNAISVAFMATGVIAPVLANLYGFNTSSISNVLYDRLIVAFVCFLGSLVLHYSGRRILRGIK